MSFSRAAVGLNGSKDFRTPRAGFCCVAGARPDCGPWPRLSSRGVKPMPKVRLLLRSSLMKDALSALLTTAGFCVSREPGPAGNDTTVVLDLDDCVDPEETRARQRHGAKIVALASEADCPTMSGDQIAPLDGLLTYALSADDWVRALRLICAGERVLPSALAWGQRLPARPRENDLRSGGDRLSPREREVLLQVVEGRANKVIARHLHIAEGTVKVHLKSLQRKIRVDNRTQAAIWALTHLPALADQAADAA